MSVPIRRRSLPGSLRYLADRLDSDNVTEAERAGVVVALRALADEVDSPPPCQSSRCNLNLSACVCGTPFDE